PSQTAIPRIAPLDERGHLSPFEPEMDHGEVSAQLADASSALRCHRPFLRLAHLSSELPGHSIIPIDELSEKRTYQRRASYSKTKPISRFPLESSRPPTNLQEAAATSRLVAW